MSALSFLVGKCSRALAELEGTAPSLVLGKRSHDRPGEIRV